jgi:hypothetical protein
LNLILQDNEFKRYFGKIGHCMFFELPTIMQIFCAPVSSRRKSLLAFCAEQ